MRILGLDGKTGETVAAFACCVPTTQRIAIEYQELCPWRRINVRVLNQGAVTAQFMHARRAPKEIVLRHQLPYRMVRQRDAECFCGCVVKKDFASVLSEGSCDEKNLIWRIARRPVWQRIVKGDLCTLEIYSVV